VPTLGGIQYRSTFENSLAARWAMLGTLIITGLTAATIVLSNKRLEQRVVLAHDQ
jgi:hypothetical protein